MNEDLDAPNVKAGYCPVCNEKANIWVEGMWHCRMCNWSGLKPQYEVHQSVLDRLEYME